MTSRNPQEKSPRKDSNMSNNVCNNCQHFNPIGRCEAWLPPDDDLLVVLEVEPTTPACEHYSIVEGGE